MDRRQVLKGAATAAAATSLAFPQVIRAARKNRFRWRLVMVIPKTLPVWADSVVAFAKQLHEMSDGTLSIRVYGAGELVPALGTFDAVRAGQVEMGHSAAYYWQGKIPAAAFFCAVPFGLDLAGMRAWLGAEGQQLWDELYRPHGILSLPAGNTGLQMGGWFRKPIQSIADFKGLKMRIPGLGGKTIARLGAKPLLVPGGEIFTNLTTGVIDATEWVGPYHDYLMGFYKAAKFYHYPGWHEPAPALELMINRKAWDALPNSLQTMVRAGARALDWEIAAKWKHQDAMYLQKIRAMPDVKILPFPDEVLKQLFRHSQEVKKEVAATSPLAAKIHRSYSDFQKLYQEQVAVTNHKYLDTLRMG